MPTVRDVDDVTVRSGAEAGAAAGEAAEDRGEPTEEAAVSQRERFIVDTDDRRRTRVDANHHGRVCASSQPPQLKHLAGITHLTQDRWSLIRKNCSQILE